MKTTISLLGDLIDLNRSQTSVFVLKGFSNSDLQEISSKLPHIMGELPITHTGKLELETIQKGFVKLIAGISTATVDSPVFMEFESFIQLARNVNLDEFGKKVLIIENNLLKEYPNPSNVQAEDFEALINANAEIPEEGGFFEYYSNATRFNSDILVEYMNGFSDEYDCVSRIFLFDEKEPDLQFANETTASKCDLVFQPFNHEYLSFKLHLFNGDLPSHVSILVGETAKQQKELYDELRLLAGVLEALGVPSEIFIQDNRVREEFRDELTDLLQKHWKSSGFRELEIYRDPDVSKEIINISQAAVVEEVISQYENGQKEEAIRDIFLTAPTGAGKSLLFQLPAIYLAEHYQAVTIVISPLIALMKDQVKALQTDRGYHGVAYINSELSIVDREHILNQVYSGEISVLYLSPELLLSYDLRMFLGERQLGLLVVDEAHLVTTWGRDFRVDYWHLGNYIKKVRKYTDYRFPVMAVTATAVYDGPNDMIFETFNSLAMETPVTYIGKVRREDISFDISQVTIESSHEQEKLDLTAGRIDEFIENGEKTIVYCPWTNQLENIRQHVNNKDGVAIYYGGLDKELKDENYENFKAGEVKTIVSTKAFGMGVDIDDITRVYHHAPSGHLADYVQEIGRLARRSDLQGVAKIDFNRRDLKFTKILYGLSSIKQYQVSMVLEKLLKIYDIKKKRNLLVSVEDFEFIFNFDNVDVEQKVKSSLLLLEKDLIKKHRYNVVIARPKSLFTSVFARINSDEEARFLAKYGDDVKHIYNRKVEEKGQKVYKIELDKIWEKYYNDQSFPLIKKQFFDKELFEEEGFYVSPQMRLQFTLHENAAETFEALTTRFAAVEQCFTKMKGFFTKREFAKELEFLLKDRLLAKRVADLVLSIYASPVDPRQRGGQFVKPECFIQQRRTGHEYKYQVIDRAYPKVRSAMRRRFQRMFGHIKEAMQTTSFFIPVKDDKNIGMIQMAYVLEAFDLATYELAGGEKPGVFIRINDPVKLKRIAKRGYTNDILREVDRRQQTSVAIMEYFFTHNLSTEQRWDFIEQYFLGSTAEELIGTESEVETEN